MPSSRGPLDPVRAGICFREALAEVPLQFHRWWGGQTLQPGQPEASFSSLPCRNRQEKGGLCCHLVVTSGYCAGGGVFRNVALRTFSEALDPVVQSFMSWVAVAVRTSGLSFRSLVASAGRRTWDILPNIGPPIWILCPSSSTDSTSDIVLSAAHFRSEFLP